MEIQKVFSNNEYPDEKLYSIILSEQEFRLYSEFQKEFGFRQLVQKFKNNPYVHNIVEGATQTLNPKKVYKAIKGSRVDQIATDLYAPTAFAHNSVSKLRKGLGKTGKQVRREIASAVHNPVGAAGNIAQTVRETTGLHVPGTEYWIPNVGAERVTMGYGLSRTLQDVGRTGVQKNKIGFARKVIQTSNTPVLKKVGQVWDKSSGVRKTVAKPLNTAHELAEKHIPTLGNVIDNTKNIIKK